MDKRLIELAANVFEDLAGKMEAAQPADAAFLRGLADQYQNRDHRPDGNLADAALSTLQDTLWACQEA